MEKPKIKPRLKHVPIERYQARASELLRDWEKAAFSETFEVETVEPGGSIVMQTMSGEVLDRINRPLSAMRQIAALIESPERDLGPIYFSDFYTPGVDALAYTRKRFDAYAFCWAQTWDRFDFTRQMPWMRAWEIMGWSIYRKIFVASDLLADLITSTIFPDMGSKIEVVGLPFNSNMVRKRVDTSKFPLLEYDVVFSSRLDSEKNPLMFLEMSQKCPSLKFVVCTGRDRLASNDPRIAEAFERAAQTQKNLTVFVGLTKGEYYAILSRSKVQVNFSSQDWVSWTLLEALTFGCTPCYPNTRSFPEAFGANMDYLYPANDLNAAIERVKYLLDRPITRPEADSLLAPHDAALGQITAIMARQ